MGLGRAWFLTLDSRDPRAASPSWVPQAEGRERELTMQQVAAFILSFQPHNTPGREVLSFPFYRWGN